MSTIWDWLDWAPRALSVRTSRSKRSADFIALLEKLDRQYGRGCRDQP
ncbi:hypothetical protein [Microvirga massiliensis]|nr:hypothetical protein [Microvirga massiliensis]